MDPTRFIIYATEDTAVAAVVDPRTYESLDHRKWTGPRPLKTLAYNFGYIFDNKGKVLVDKRATNKDESDAFARCIMKAAVEISREEYLKEMDRVIWPPKSSDALRSRTASTPIAENRLYSIKLRSDSSPAEDSHVELASALYKKMSRELSPESKREELIQKINMMMRQMDSDDLEKLYSYTMKFGGG
jgi:hypothetical protein